MSVALSQDQQALIRAMSPTSVAYEMAEELGPYIGITNSKDFYKKVLEAEGGQREAEKMILAYLPKLSEHKSAAAVVVLANTAKYIKVISSPSYGFFGAQMILPPRNYTRGIMKRQSVGFDLGQTIQNSFTLDGSRDALNALLSDENLTANIEAYSFAMVYGFPCWCIGRKREDAGSYIQGVNKRWGGGYDGPNVVGGERILPTRRPNQQGNICIGSLGMQMRNNAYGPAGRSSGELDIFLNAISPIEFSRCVPFFDMKIVSNDIPIEGFGPDSGFTRFPSMHRFFMDSHAAGTSLDDKLASLAMYPSPYQTPDDVANREPKSTTGMEVFTMPQSIVNGNDYHKQKLNFRSSAPPMRAVSILDRFRPFLTVDSFTTKIEPQTGFMSYESATLSMTLHDRSRLAELAPLVKPGSFNGVDIIIEYGWASQSDSYGPNPVQSFLNGSRKSGVFGVTNSSYSFTDDGQVKITLALWSKGPAQMTRTSVTEGMKNSKGEAIEDKFRVIESITADIALLKGQIGEGRTSVPDILGSEIINTVSSTSSAASMTAKQRKEILKKLRKAQKSGVTTDEKKEFIKQVKALISEQAALENNVSTLVSKQIKKLTKTLKYKSSAPPDCFTFRKLMGENTAIEANNSGRSWKKYYKPNFCSFAEVVYRFVAAPLERSREFDEVQCYFYNFNKYAAYMSAQPISEMPIRLNKTSLGKFDPILGSVITEQISKGGGMTIAEFLGAMNENYFNNKALMAYGFSSLYEKKDGKIIIREKKKNSYKTEIDNILKKAYDGPISGAPDLKFVCPKIGVLCETVPNFHDASKNILRMHFFDQNARLSNSFGSVLDALRSDLMGSTITFAEFSRKDGSKYQQSDLNTFRSLLQKAVSTGLLKIVGETDGVGAEEINPDVNTVFSIGGTPENFNNLISQGFPTLKVGTQNSVLKGISLQSNKDSRMAAIEMLKAMKNQGTQDKSSLPSGAKVNGLPERLQPVTCDFTLLGCPYVEPFQELFIDFSAGTTATDIYVCAGVEHSIKPGEYLTKVNAFPRGAAGVYEALQCQMDKVLYDIAGSEPGNVLEITSMAQLVEAIKQAAALEEQSTGS